MSKQAVKEKFAPPTVTLAELPAVIVEPLREEQRAEVLTFLAARPVHTVFMVSMIHDNGLVSPLNRGTFYGCRDEIGHLQGVALIGHATLMEARTPAALAAFSRVAQTCITTHVMMGEQERLEKFWEIYAEQGQALRLLCRELLIEQRWPIEAQEAVPNLRHATVDDLPYLIPVNAQMVFEECGLNPVETDPEGFRERLARRIAQGRVWVWIEDEELIFKVDIISDAQDVVYLEGTYVAPEHRGKGFGRRCMLQLSRHLLQRASSVCLLVNDQNNCAQAFYRKVGFKVLASYDTIYLQREKAKKMSASA